MPDANKSMDGLGAVLYVVGGTFKSMLNKSPIKVSWAGITDGCCTGTAAVVTPTTTSFL